MPEKNGIDFFKEIITNFLMLTEFSLRLTMRVPLSLSPLTKLTFTVLLQKPWKREEFTGIINNALESFELKKQN